ncbi:TRM11 family SAM-dependent methyltransferase [Paenibacillus alginolyticus]|uniref:RsmD family RNA methyltransferase n=1 Tax=Paenibacillus alginolyticus TaxID=59839 RepID=A0ABT4GIM2_9BACL|nr:RsmD family RNA methyltransferase [Paenibacillus alginolyticus]MCY9696057.1 RsmD family RNA methyltransferase [Paenibacillus alginolyticus]MEC0147495.1 RsmD family RNA methyltransferase [Paenibacillus alginolyticus]
MKHIYVYACHEDEQALCQLELRTLLGADVVLGARYAVSARRVEPSRSPFLKLRLDVLFEAGSLPELASQVATLTVQGSTFKVAFAETDAAVSTDRQREVAREIGRHLRGKAEMRRPEQWFAVTELGGRWLFGHCSYGEAVWLQHQQKPQNYSTALGTRVARAVVNIAVPEVVGTRVIDPCCGIGTVLVEAMSMGIDIVGCDINPLAVRGARVNLDHFGMPNVVRLTDMRTLSPAGEQEMGAAQPVSPNSPQDQARYDALILDMPYNLCSKLPEDEQLQMLQSARRLARRAVIITTEQIDSLLAEAGFRIAERCAVHKGNFSRQIIVCM